MVIYISLVYSPFSDKVGPPLHDIPSSGVLMKSIINITFYPELN